MDISVYRDYNTFEKNIEKKNMELRWSSDSEFRHSDPDIVAEVEWKKVRWAGHLF